MKKVKHMRRNMLLASIGLSLSTFFGAVQAQSEYPTRAIKMIIPFAPGGTTDVVGRIVAEGLSKELGQPVVVENRGGAAGTIGASALTRAPADGYTIGLMNVSTHGTNPAVYKNLSYDIEKGFTPISKLVSFPGVIVVNSDFPAQNFEDFIKILKENPGKYSYGSSGTGGATHMAMEQFKLMTDIDITHIPYRGSGPALTDVSGGQVPILLDALPSAISFIQSGRLVPIGLSAMERSSQLPNLQTFNELGLKDYAPDFWNGLMGPADLPQEVLDTLHEALLRTLERPEVKSRLEDLGALVATTTPEELGNQIHNDAITWKQVAEFANVSID